MDNITRTTAHTEVVSVVQPLYAVSCAPLTGGLPPARTTPRKVPPAQGAGDAFRGGPGVR
eukprot:12391992-Alexandrium_andersonii.AAC.1